MTYRTVAAAVVAAGLLAWAGFAAVVMLITGGVR